MQCITQKQYAEDHVLQTIWHYNILQSQES